MTKPYHERFAQALRQKVPESFTVDADRSLAVVAYGRATLVAPVPLPVDGRKPVTDKDVEFWLAASTGRLRRIMPDFTPEAKEAAQALLDVYAAHVALTGKKDAR